MKRLKKQPHKLLEFQHVSRYNPGMSLVLRPFIHRRVYKRELPHVSVKVFTGVFRRLGVN